LPNSLDSPRERTGVQAGVKEQRGACRQLEQHLEDHHTAQCEKKQLQKVGKQPKYARGGKKVGGELKFKKKEIFW